MQDEAHKRFYAAHKDTCKQRALKYYYAHRNERKEKMRAHAHMNKQEKADYDKKYYDAHKEEIMLRINVWKREHPESYAYRRSLGDNVICPNPFTDDETVDFHHVDDNNGLYIPSDLHRLYNGPDRAYHRECLQYIINQLYRGDSLTKV